MAIFAMGVIALTSLNAQNYRQVKANEIADLANKIMVSTLEYMKSPSGSDAEDVDSVQNILDQALASNEKACFALIGNIDQGSTFQIGAVTNPVYCPTGVESILNDSARLEWERCADALSPYNQLDASSYSPNLQGLKICNQLIVTRDDIERGYIIISRVVYEKGLYDSSTNSNYSYNEIFGFRPYTYEE